MMPKDNLSLNLFSPAKINLFLHIIGKRDDGYHNLQTVFRLLDWGDYITFLVSEKTYNPNLPMTNDNLPISLESNITVTANLEDNLITQAAIAMISKLKKQTEGLLDSLPVINIRLDKKLPTGAGLGGGSSNAATTLIALNKLWKANFSKAELIKIGASVGADVPIFIYGQDALGEGIGEKLKPIQLPHQHYLILNPDAHASTKELFSHPELKKTKPEINYSEIISQIDKFLDNLYSPFENVFQPIVTKLVSEIAVALNYLKSIEELTGTTARLTGSGSSLFLPIPQEKLEVVKSFTKYSSPPCAIVFTQTLNAVQS